MTEDETSTIDVDEPRAIWADVAECPVHTDRYDEDCEACEGETLARNAVIERIGKEAGDRLQGVARMGGPDPTIMFIGVRLGVLCDTLFQHNARHMQQFEGEVARRTLLEIRKMQATLMEATLLTPKNGLHVVKGKGRR